MKILFAGIIFISVFTDFLRRFSSAVIQRGNGSNTLSKSWLSVFFSFLLYISLCWIFKYAKINPRCMFFRIFSFNLRPNKVNIASKLFKNVESRSTTKFSIKVVKLQIIGENWKIGITMNLNQFKQNMKNQQHRF